MRAQYTIFLIKTKQDKTTNGYDPTYLYPVQLSMFCPRVCQKDSDCEDFRLRDSETESADEISTGSCEAEEV